MLSKHPFYLGRATVKLLIFLACVISSISASAHPHVFMDTKISFQFKEKALEGFWVEWLFDEIFSASIKMDFDADRNNQFSPEEVSEIENGAFANLKNFNYFTFVTTGEQKKPVQNVTFFSAQMLKDRLRYRFFVPFPIKSTKSSQSLRVSVYDENFYCDIAFHKKMAVTLKGAQGLKTTYRVELDEENVINYDNSYQTASREGVFYSGITNPYEIVLDFRRAH